MIKTKVNNIKLILELVVKLVHIYGLGEKNVRCLFTHSYVLQLPQLLLLNNYISLKKNRSL